MLGLVSSETIQNYWFNNTRRRILYNYPQGTAPLTAFMSLLDPEFTPIQEYGWQEKRWQTIYTNTATGPSSGVPFYGGGTTTALSDPATLAQGESVRVYVTDASNFRVDGVIMISNVNLTGSYTDNVNGKITAVNTTGLEYVEFVVTVPTASMSGGATLINNSTALPNGNTGNVGLLVFLMGSSYQEGAKIGDGGRMQFPTVVKNYTQAHATPFELTMEALKNPLTYDKSGVYRDYLKTNGIDHLTGLEMTLYFQDRATFTETDSNGVQRLRYQSGGLLWFLKQWELGSVAAGGAFDYGQPNVSTATNWDTTINKRIIKLAGAVLTTDQFDDLNSRAFERTNSADWCKLCLCGQGYLNKIWAKFRKEMTFTSLRDEGFKGFNFELVKHMTNAGTVYYKIHPLWNEQTGFMRNSAFYIDPGYLKWRPFTDCDTDVKKGIQFPNELIRKDMFYTQGGPEFWFPEAHLFVDQLGGIAT